METDRRGENVKRAGPTPARNDSESEGIFQLQRSLLRNKKSHTHTRLPSLEHQCWEKQSHNIWL